MSIKNESTRIHLRKDTAVFRVTFFSDVAQTVAVTPLDVTQYPAYSIYDPNNSLVQSGVGQPEASPGKYKAEFVIPHDAPLSQDLSRWRIEWVMVDVNSRQFDFVEEFDVKDTVITTSETREQKFITLVGQDTRVILRQSRKPFEISLDVLRATNLNDVIVTNATLGTAVTDIREAVDGDSIVYYFDIPGNLIPNQCQTFSVIWKIRDAVTEPNQFVYQVLTAITPQVLAEVTAVRMLIDKLQKRLGTVQAYEDSDIVEYLGRATDLINATYPTTFFHFGGIPPVLTTYHVLMAAWYGLQAQYILNVELGFSFSGQTVTLDYDQASGLADIAGRWNDFIKEGLAQAKMSIVRRTSAVGTVSGRGYRYTGLHNYVYKVSSGTGSANIIGTLTNLGLLW
jgi:hypothetical protein